MSKDLKRSLCGDIGLVVFSCLGSHRTHPDGVEGASMARRAPFSLSSIPVYIEHSMKLLCVHVCVTMRARARARACVCVCVTSNSTMDARRFSPQLKPSLEPPGQTLEPPCQK